MAHAIAEGWTLWLRKSLPRAGFPQGIKNSYRKLVTVKDGKYRVIWNEKTSG